MPCERLFLEFVGVTEILYKECLTMNLDLQSRLDMRALTLSLCPKPADSEKLHFISTEWIVNLHYINGHEIYLQRVIV